MSGPGGADAVQIGGRDVGGVQVSGVDRADVDVVGVDVGGTAIKAVRMRGDGVVVAEQTRPTPRESGPLTEAVIAAAAELRTARTAAVGIGSPGVIEAGVVRFAANLGWRDEPLAERVAGALGMPAVLDRDVAAAGLAEAAALAASGAPPDVLFVSVGTGIAAAHLVGGRVRHGATGRSGEIGHTPVHPRGLPCACGQLGCLEAYASAAAVARRYAARTGQDRDAAAVAARLGSDPDADAVWAEAVEALALALATQTLVTDPGVIVLGGGLAEAGEALLGPTRRALTGLLAWRDPPPLLRASLGPAAGRIGAARLALASLVTPGRVPADPEPAGHAPADPQPVGLAPADPAPSPPEPPTDPALHGNRR